MWPRFVSVSGPESEQRLLSWSSEKKQSQLRDRERERERSSTGPGLSALKEQERLGFALKSTQSNAYGADGGQFVFCAADVLGTRRERTTVSSVLRRPR